METKHKIGDTVFVFTYGNSILKTLIVGVRQSTKTKYPCMVYYTLNPDGKTPKAHWEEDIYNTEEEARQNILLVEIADFEKRKAELNGEKFVEKEIDKKAYCSRENGDPYPPCWNPNWNCEDCKIKYGIH
jgi:hypothetical protein